MQVYSDGQVVYSVDVSSIDAEVSIAVGNHWIVVQAWHNHGNVYKAPGFWIDVTSGGGGGPTYSMIQAMSDWQTCDSCAASGPTHRLN
jgi:hypothetical protein